MCQMAGTAKWLWCSISRLVVNNLLWTSTPAWHTAIKEHIAAILSGVLCWQGQKKADRYGRSKNANWVCYGAQHVLKWRPICNTDYSLSAAIYQLSQT